MIGCWEGRLCVVIGCWEGRLCGVIGCWEGDSLDSKVLHDGPVDVGQLSAPEAQDLGERPQHALHALEFHLQLLERDPEYEKGRDKSTGS